MARQVLVLASMKTIDLTDLGTVHGGMLRFLHADGNQPSHEGPGYQAAVDERSKCLAGTSLNPFTWGHALGCARSFRSKVNELEKTPNS